MTKDNTCGFLSIFFILFLSLSLLVMFVRELHLIGFLAGILVNTLINELLKEFISEPRPDGACKGDFGMPSNHSQFMFFFATYWCLLFTNRVTLPSSLSNIIGKIGVFVLASVVAFSR